MIKEFLKLGGCKTPEELLKKYPTEEAFLKAHPEALEVMKRGGSFNTPPTEAQFFDYGHPTAGVPMIMQYGDMVDGDGQGPVREVNPPMVDAGYGMDEVTQIDTSVPKTSKTVSQIWKEVTGKSWKEAKALGLSDGSYESNMKLRKLLLSGVNPVTDMPDIAGELNTNQDFVTRQRDIEDYHFNRRGDSHREKQNAMEDYHRNLKSFTDSKQGAREVTNTPTQLPGSPNKAPSIRAIIDTFKHYSNIIPEGTYDYYRNMTGESPYTNYPKRSDGQGGYYEMGGELDEYQTEGEVPKRKVPEWIPIVGGGAAGAAATVGAKPIANYVARQVGNKLSKKIPDYGSLKTFLDQLDDLKSQQIFVDKKGNPFDSKGNPHTSKTGKLINELGEIIDPNVVDQKNKVPMTRYDMEVKNVGNPNVLKNVASENLVKTVKPYNVTTTDQLFNRFPNEKIPGQERIMRRLNNINLKTAGKFGVGAGLGALMGVGANYFLNQPEEIPQNSYNTDEPAPQQMQEMPQQAPRDTVLNSFEHGGSYDSELITPTSYSDVRRNSLLKFLENSQYGGDVKKKSLNKAQMGTSVVGAPTQGNDKQVTGLIPPFGNSQNQYNEQVYGLDPTGDKCPEGYKWDPEREMCYKDTRRTGERATNMMIGATNMFANALGMDEERGYEMHQDNMKLADATFGVKNPTFRYGNFADGNNPGVIPSHMGYATDMGYAQTGGEIYMSDNEIENFLKYGGQLEIIN